MSQIEDNDNERLGKLVVKTQVLKLIKIHFAEAIEKTKLRSPAEQNIIGNNLTSLEIELKKEIKLLDTFE